MAEPVYRRVVIKLSGEYLAGSHSLVSTSLPLTALPTI